jgi:hypothetical protein
VRSGVARRGWLVRAPVLLVTPVVALGCDAEGLAGSGVRVAVANSLTGLHSCARFCDKGLATRRQACNYNVSAQLKCIRPLRNKKVQVFSTPLINVESLIVPEQATTKQDLDCFRWKPSGPKAHFFQLTATELACKLQRTFKTDVLKREAALAQYWWADMLGAFGYYSMTHTRHVHSRSPHTISSSCKNKVRKSCGTPTVGTHGTA